MTYLVNVTHHVTVTYHVTCSVTNHVTLIDLAL